MPVLKEFDLITSGSKEKIRAFQLQTRCVTALYERFFPKFKTKDCWKVLVRCDHDAARIHYRNIGGVCELSIVADVDSFFLLTDAEKKVWSFEQLKIGLLELIDQTQWKAEPFVETFQRVGELNLQNVWLWKKVRSPSQKLSAEIWINHDVHSCVINLVVRDASGQEIKRQELITELPSEWAYAHHLGSLKWISPACVVLENKDRDRKWSYEVGDIQLGCS